jgi:hypothetical protein
MSRGGSRAGAGRPGYRPQTQTLLRLSLDEIRVSGAFRNGAESCCTWTGGGGSDRGVARLHVSSQGDSISITVQTAGAHDGGRTFNFSIRLVYTSSQLGGQRAWFECPNCRGKKVHLYVVPSLGALACGPCLRVAYRVQSLSPMDRMWYRLDKLEQRLGGGGRSWDKVSRPKGMHRRTFLRLSDAYHRLWYSMLRGALEDDDRRRGVAGSEY